MVRVEDAVIARLESNGEKFEMLVDPDLALKLKQGHVVSFNDLVVIDTPPIGLFSDALLLVRYADVVALVTRHGATSRKELMSCLDLLDKSSIRATGVILNAVPSSSHAYGYGYGYYGYGEDQTERYAHEKSAA